MLTEADFQRAALHLDCPVSRVKAVCEVEAPGGGFDSTGAPRILFEAHRFAKLTGGKFNAAYPQLSSPVWNRRLYAAGATPDIRNGGEHLRLQAASSLNRAAALMATSWGRFQILGENYAACGFANLQDFINAMYAGESEQLDAFIEFIDNDPVKLKALREGDWALFARRYNGPAYAENQYDVKLAAADRRFA